jgi:hypothetical protein
MDLCAHIHRLASSGGRTLRAHFEFAPTNIELTIVRKDAEENPRILWNLGRFVCILEDVREPFPWTARALRSGHGLMVPAVGVGPRNRRLLATGMAFWPVLLGAVGPLVESPAPQANRANAAV